MNKFEEFDKILLSELDNEDYYKYPFEDFFAEITKLEKKFDIIFSSERFTKKKNRLLQDYEIKSLGFFWWCYHITNLLYQNGEYDEEIILYFGGKILERTLNETHFMYISDDFRDDYQIKLLLKNIRKEFCFFQLKHNIDNLYKIIKLILYGINVKNHQYLPNFLESYEEEKHSIYYNFYDKYKEEHEEKDDEMK